METFSPGQRWVSDTESELGLGAVLAVDPRNVTILFMASHQTRLYAKKTAPLTRVQFMPGDRVQSFQGWFLQVDSVREEQGLLTYEGQNEQNEFVVLPEAELNNFIQFTRPEDRLFAAQVDDDRWFELRKDIYQHRYALCHAQVRGLLGPRMSLVPHQLYIAHEVANRHAPRVLLADEVGLGKTIEAGLILHHQLFTGRASRVLVVVPASLQHQWLVEMKRRFNLDFSLFDADRVEDSADKNPFESEQLVLVSLDFVTGKEEGFLPMLAADWDLLVVDEAHHLGWSEEAPSLAYQRIEQLGQRARGLILITATPEQLGVEGHFARLRLLDADRFTSLDSFLAEQNQYRAVADNIDSILANPDWQSASVQRLVSMLHPDQQARWQSLEKESMDGAALQQEIGKLIDGLIDQQGTGRVLFRNSRAQMKGFPERNLQPVYFDLPTPYQELLQSAVDSTDEESFLRELQCAPSSDQQEDWNEDPRLYWLIDLMKQLAPAKLVLICSTKDQVKGLAQALRQVSGIPAAMFHEGLSLLERDRSAAYFAEGEEGAQILLCSEIGSEGRNFQFAHHLVLFDLPLNPDLLEQRIGRLDRIGQTSRIEIHVPIFRGTCQEYLFRWYHEGLNAFLDTCSFGAPVWEIMKSALMELVSARPLEPGQFEDLLKETLALKEISKERIQKGRDRLLELNSFREPVANLLIDEIIQWESRPDLYQLMDRLLDRFGVEFQPLSHRTWLMKAGDEMETDAFPLLPEDGMTVTFSREESLAREDAAFLSWEHPLVQDAMDLVTSQDYGKTSVIAIKSDQFKAGTMLLETLFILEVVNVADPWLQNRAPSVPLRLVVETIQGDLTDQLDSADWISSPVKLSKNIIQQICKTQQAPVRALLLQARQLAESRRDALIAATMQPVVELMDQELVRLQELASRNPSVRVAEIEQLRGQKELLQSHINAAQIRLDSLRLVIVA